MASYPRWNVISRSARRNSPGEVDDDRRTLILCERTGCLEMWTLGPNEATSVVMAATTAGVSPLVVAMVESRCYSQSKRNAELLWRRGVGAGGEELCVRVRVNAELLISTL